MNESLEFSDGKSAKFWKISVRGKTQTVNYGRLGTTGQKKTKQFETPAAAKQASEKLIEAKKKKGYVSAGKPQAETKRATRTKTSTPAKRPSGKSAATKSTPKSASQRAKASRVKNPDLVLQTLLMHYILIYQDDTDLWFYDIDSDDVEDLNRGIALLDYESVYDRFQKEQTHVWRFQTAKAATDALTALQAKAKRETFYFSVVNKLQFDASRDLSKPDVKLTQSQQRLGGFETAPSGPVAVQWHGMPEWIYPRPPSQCLACGGAMQPVVSVSGTLGLQPGKGRQSVLLLACPNAFPHTAECPGLLEAIYQTDGSPPDGSWYLENSYRREFANVHVITQFEPTGKQHFAYVEHRGEHGVPGEVILHRCKSLTNARTEAEKRATFLKFKNGFQESKQPKMNPKSKKLYQELFDVGRRMIGDSPKLMKPKTIKLKRTIEPYVRLTSKGYRDWRYDHSLSILGGEPFPTEPRKNMQDFVLVMNLWEDYGSRETIFSPVLDRGHPGIFGVYVNSKSGETLVTSHFD